MSLVKLRRLKLRAEQVRQLSLQRLGDDGVCKIWRWTREEGLTQVSAEAGNQNSEKRAISNASGVEDMMVCKTVQCLACPGINVKTSDGDRRSSLIRAQINSHKSLQHQRWCGNKSPETNQQPHKGGPYNSIQHLRICGDKSPDTNLQPHKDHTTIYPAGANAVIGAQTWTYKRPHKFGLYNSLRLRFRCGNRRPDTNPHTTQRHAIETIYGTGTDAVTGAQT